MNKVADKQIVQDVLSRMPDDASLHDIAQELEFIAAVRQGLAEFDENKDSISIEPVERKPAYSVTIGRRRRGRQKPHAQKQNAQTLNAQKQNAEANVQKQKQAAG